MGKGERIQRDDAPVLLWEPPGALKNADWKTKVFMSHIV